MKKSSDMLPKRLTIEQKSGPPQKSMKSKPEQAGALWSDKLARSLAESNGDNKPKESAKRKLTKAYSESIPDISRLDPELREIARDLLQQAHDAKRTRELAEQTQKEAVEQLAAIALSEDWDGIRDGRRGLLVFGYIARSSFDVDEAKRMLLELGADPVTVGELHKKGKEFLSTRLEEFDV